MSPPVDISNSSYPIGYQTTTTAPSSRFPQDVGILAMEMYFPTTYVNQADLGTLSIFPRFLLYLFRHFSNIYFFFLIL